MSLNLTRFSRRHFLFSTLLSAIPLSTALQPLFAQQTEAKPRSYAYPVVAKGTHPGIIFGAAELPAMHKRAQGQGLAADAYRKVKQEATEDLPRDLTPKQMAGREGIRLAAKLEAMALVYQVENDRQMGLEAVKLLRQVAVDADAKAVFVAINDDFFGTEHWPKALAFAWDWLYAIMPDAERGTILAGLEAWSDALEDHTQSWWWRDATYNCGAIPVGAQGILLAAIRGESKHPQLEQRLADCLRKVTRNYFPLTWRDNGLCSEGPGYAHYLKNPIQFLDAVRRTGGEDFVPQSGGVNAMHYLRHQWMPQGRCATVGDNTEYGRRVFQAIYLYGIREMNDAAGLWTFEKYADRARTEAFLQFLYYPDALTPRSPGELKLRTSHYFEFDRNQAGYLFARNEWDNEQASWLAFSTRYENSNHTHYDMNSFVFTVFGEEFGAHTNIYGYSQPLHGADLEHNIVIIDEGGMPVADRPTSAGDDGSIYGYLTGVGTGEFGDYVRGDAHRSYADRSVKTDKPAKQADRVLGYIKEGRNPYIVVTDQIRKDDAPHDYHWQWYTMAQSIEGKGTVAEPFRLRGERAHCKLVFLTPEAPDFSFQIVKNEQRNRNDSWGLLRVKQRAEQAEFVMLAIAWADGEPEPAVSVGPAVKGATGGRSFLVSTYSGKDSQPVKDLVLWQPGATGKMLTCRSVVSNGLLTVVRRFDSAQPQGYLLGDGSQLRVGGRKLVDAPQACSVSAAEKAVVVTSARRPYEPLPPLTARGRFWLPAKQSDLWRDDVRLPASSRDGSWLALA